MFFMLRGIDISSWQKTVDFDLLKPSVDFVMIKSSEGTGFVDPLFYRNRDETRRLGIPRGFYHFARPDLGTMPEPEADFFTSILGEIQKGEILCLDFEKPYGGDRVGWCMSFLNRVNANVGGYKPLLYISGSATGEVDWSRVIQADYGLWVALWDQDPNSMPASPWPVVAMKQYSATQRFNGIDGDVDGDIFNGDVNLFYAYGYRGDAPVAAPQPAPVPTAAPTSVTGTNPIYVSAKPGWELVDIGREAGWPEAVWRNPDALLSQLKQYNPTHPAILRGQLLVSDPPLIVGYDTSAPVAASQPVNPVMANLTSANISTMSNNSPISTFSRNNSVPQMRSYHAPQMPQTSINKDDISKLFVELMGEYNTTKKNIEKSPEKSKKKGLEYFLEILAGSKVLIAVLISLGFILLQDLHPDIDLSIEEVTNMTFIVLGYIGVQGFTDYKQKSIKHEQLKKENREAEEITPV
jgi:GH25 family lysozyme M1 (1,4-beta-N-acetylmuramidase)